MTPKNNTDPLDDDSLGVLDEAASLDTAGIGILGGTAQVNVALPQDEDDDLADDGVVGGEIIADLIVDRAPVVDDASLPGAIDAAGIVIEIPAEPVVAVEPDDIAPEHTELVEVEPDDLEPEMIEPETIEPETIEPPVIEPDDIEPAVAEVAVSTGSGAPILDLDEVPVPDAAPAPATQDVPEIRAETVEEQSEKEDTVVDDSNEKNIARRSVDVDSTPARVEVALTSKRLDDLGDSARESADLLTADRLLDPHQLTKPEPEGAWSQFLYAISRHRINIGDGKRARARKELSAKIAAPLAGGARFVPVLSRKGGVGKTTITALLGMALADARDDRVIAVDANPDRGTLAERIVRPNQGKSVRDLVRIHDEVRGYHDISAIVARDATRLDVLASDSDPRVSEAFSDDDYRDVADVAAHYYSLVLTDTGTGIVHSVMSATLDRADQIVVVSGLSVDEARLASETLTWLETNGRAEQAREAIVVLNQSTPGAPLVRLTELEAHFGSRAKHVVRMPYDPQIAGGGPIVFGALQPQTREAARELAALLVEGLRNGIAR